MLPDNLSQDSFMAGSNKSHDCVCAELVRAPFDWLRVNAIKRARVLERVALECATQFASRNSLRTYARANYLGAAYATLFFDFISCRA